MIPSLEEALAATMGKKPVSEAQKKEIVMMHPDRLITLDDQDYTAYTQEKLQQLAESIKSNGQFAPCLVRRMPDGSLVVLAGRNRRNACKLAGVDVACIIKEYTDAEAEIVLNESNLIQREQLSLREKARGYAKLKESYIAAGEKAPVKKIAGNSGEGEKQIWRYIKLSALSDWLLDAVEQKQIAVAAGVELAQLKPESQTRLEEYLQKNPDQKIDLEDAKRIRQAEDFVSLSPAFLGQLFHAGVVFTSDTVSEHNSEKPISDIMSEHTGEKPTSDTMSEHSSEKSTSDIMSRQGSKNHVLDTVIGSDGQDFIIMALRHLGEESVFKNLVLMYQSKKDWIAELKKSHFGHADDEVELHCGAAGISIENGDGKLVTVLSYSQAYDTIAALIRQGKWLPKAKMAELAVQFWINN